MKILVATKETQGKRRNDFSHANEGEFLMHGVDCDGESVDGHCGCRRSLVGLDSRKGTTTFKVIETTLSKKDFIGLLRHSLISGHWYKEPLSRADEREITSMAIKLLELADFFPTGAILERRGGKIAVRRLASEQRTAAH